MAAGEGKRETAADKGEGRFDQLKDRLAARPGVKNPGALAAYIGRRKYTQAGMTQMAVKGKRHARSKSDLMRQMTGR